MKLPLVAAGSVGASTPPADPSRSAARPLGPPESTRPAASDGSMLHRAWSGKARRFTKPWARGDRASTRPAATPTDTSHDLVGLPGTTGQRRSRIRPGVTRYDLTKHRDPTVDNDAQTNTAGISNGLADVSISRRVVDLFSRLRLGLRLSRRHRLRRGPVPGVHSARLPARRGSAAAAGPARAPARPAQLRMGPPCAAQRPMPSPCCTKPLSAACATRVHHQACATIRWRVPVLELSGGGEAGAGGEGLRNAALSKQALVLELRV